MSRALKAFGRRLDSGVDQVRKITGDFCSQLNLTLFGYVRVYHDGRLGWVTSNAEHDRLLIDSGALFNDPLVDTAQGLKEGPYVWCHERAFPGSAAFYHDRSRLFKVDHGLILVKHQKDFLETACFSGSLADKPLYTLFMNEAPLFEAFMEHFKSELNSPLLSLLNEGLLISEIKERYGTPASDPIEAKLRLLLARGCGCKELLKLSRRERECLALLDKRLTYQEMAKALGLSARTIEHYLEAVKNKLGLETRAELLQIAKKFAPFLK